MLPYKQIAVVDFETYYDDEYSLSKMSQTDYIRDPRFKIQSVSIQLLDANGSPLSDAVAYRSVDAYQALAEIDWDVTAFCAHHCQFDAFIITERLGIYPRFYICTMSMARMVFGSDIRVSLAALAHMLGLKGKVNAGALGDIKGVREPTDEQYEYLLVYNLDDVNTTRGFLQKLIRFVPEHVMRVIDITLRMYCDPILEIDGDRVEAAHKKEKEKKIKIFEEIGIDKEHFSSNEKFAVLLRDLGIEPPMKMSGKTGRPTYAFALGDLAFKELRTHPEERVRNIIEARITAKSTLLETRAAAIMRRRGLPTPIYLNVAGARTKRWSGGDGVNWQNLPKKGDGGELRRSLMAPKGCMLIIADASQIECRMNAWDCGHERILNAFRMGDDVYCINASGIYQRVITKEDQDERFVGKTFTLGAGYGAGAPKINHMLKIGQFGPPVYQDLEDTRSNLYNWRQDNQPLVQGWDTNNRNMRTAFGYGQTVEQGVIAFEGRMRGDIMMGYLHGPDGTMITYPDVRFDETGREMYYISGKGPVKLYGGISKENQIQYLSWCVLAKQMTVMEDTFDRMRIATTTHDEVVLVVPESDAEEVAREVRRIMSTPPSWCPDVPLDAEVKISPIYNKT